MFSLDKIDNFSYYCRDIIPRKTIFLKQQNEKGIVEGFFFSGATPVAFLYNKMHSESHQDILDESLLLENPLIALSDFFFSGIMPQSS